jgi:hypothetical protein
MKQFRITEVAVYLVDAEDEEEAESIFLNSEDPNEFFSYVDDREVEEA